MMTRIQWIALSSIPFVSGCDLSAAGTTNTAIEELGQNLQTLVVDFARQVLAAFLL